MVWVRSTSKRERDAETRQRRMADGIAALDAVNQRLLSPRTRLRDRVTIADEADQALADCFASRFVVREDLGAEVARALHVGVGRLLEAGAGKT